MAELCKSVGVTESPIPEFTEDEKKLNKGITFVPHLINRHKRKIILQTILKMYRTNFSFRAIKVPSIHKNPLKI